MDKRPWYFIETVDAKIIPGTEHYQCRLDLLAKDGGKSSIHVMITADEWDDPVSVVHTLLGSVGRPTQIHVEGSKLLGFTWLEGAKCR